MNVNKLDRWHQTKPGLLSFGVVELVAAYALVSLAIDDGNILVYILAIILAFGGLRNLYNLIRGKSSGKSHKTS